MVCKQGVENCVLRKTDKSLLSCCFDVIPHEVESFSQNMFVLDAGYKDILIDIYVAFGLFV